MTNDDVLELRLAMLEKVAEGARQVERQVDVLSAAVARFEHELAATRAEQSSRHETVRGSLNRIHERLDALQTAETIDQGARQERKKLAGMVIATVSVSTALLGLLVAIANGLIH